MKRLCLDKLKSSKRGVASLYVVIFATILFGVVALSCVRIMLSEFGQSSDDDLSRSAYDAAMAGVEDAKMAVNRYYRCLSGAGSSDDCTSDARAKLFQENCNSSIGIAKYLYSRIDGDAESPEVLIQEGTSSNNSDQAYTCVLVSDVVPDYRGTLTSDTNTKLVPLGVKSNERGSNLAGVKKIRFSWFSQLNEGKNGATGFKFSSGGKLSDANDTTIPPTIMLTLIKVGGTIDVQKFHEANNDANYTTVLLVPTSATVDKSANVVSYEQLRDAGNVKNRELHTPIEIQCSTTAEFACTVDLQVGGLNLTNNDSVMLVVTAPYGDTVTEFAAAVYGDDESKSIDLKGAQIRIDSTGRTNQLFRRVETRLDPSDLYFPYPQYAADLSGDGEDVFKKNFWITANCWYSKPSTLVDGAAQLCNNNGEIQDTP